MTRLTVTVLVVMTAVAGTVFTQTPARVDFGRDVQPILRQQCYGCHGPSQQMNGFRLDRRKDAMRGGTVNPGIIRPGNADASFLMARITGALAGPQMPPTGALKPEQIATIKAWMDQGAEWPDEFANEAPPVRLSAENARLMHEALWGTAASVKVALDAGGDVNTKNEAGATPLMWAVNDIAKTRVLLDRGANVNARSDDGRTPLMIAAGVAGAAPIAALLIERGASVNVKGPSLFGDTTPLTEAAYAGDEATLRLLIDHHADVNAAGPTPLALSLRSECRGCSDALLTSMATPLITPTLFLAMPPLGTGRQVDFLLSHGADPKLIDSDGATMILRAAASDAILTDTISTLIAKGVDVNAKTQKGETALQHALRRGPTPVVDALRKAGATGDLPAITGSPAPAASLRAAIERALPVLQKTDAVFLKKSGCVSCHNNTLTAVSVSAARAAGVRVDETTARESLKTIASYIDAWRERAFQGIGIPGDADTVSSILLGLHAEKFPANDATDAMAFFLKRTQYADGRWRPLAHRPPLEASDLQATAAAMRALQFYAPTAARGEYQRAVRRGAAWLASATPISNEDRAYQLLGLAWTGAPKAAIENAGRALLAEQRPDGGWSQLPTLTTDAYATGQALVALAESGRLKSTAPAYKRGVDFLLKSQFADGSWLVRTRALPIQPLFDIGFPHGLADGWISAAGTNWATLALTRAYVKPS